MTDTKGMTRKELAATLTLEIIDYGSARGDMDNTVALEKLRRCQELIKQITGDDSVGDVAELSEEVEHLERTIADLHAALRRKEGEQVALTGNELHALRQSLRYMEDETGKSHLGYFGPQGWAWKILRSLYERAGGK